jgi:membrane associated rhomboid family serine protease
MFLPLGDDNSRRQSFPIVTVALILVNVVAFAGELFANSQGNLESFVRFWALVPADYTEGAGIAGPVPLTLLTSMFLHGGFMHILGNMLYLWIFGDNVEQAFGSVRFLGFYLLCGIIASGVHILSMPGSQVPSLGASGAISGVLGSYLLMFPGNRVNVLFFFRVIPVPAIVVIGFWAIFQFLSGAGSIVAEREGGGGGGVAYLAHVGGFVAGLVLTFVMWPGRQNVRRGGETNV